MKKPWEIINDFKHEVKNTRRSIFSLQTNEFFQKIRQGLSARITVKPSGTYFFRSQMGYVENFGEEYIDYDGYGEERMKPIRGSALEGRSNPKGISVLYLSSDETTSMSELRPQIGQVISCGKFKTNKELKLVDCYTFNNIYSEGELVFGNPCEEEWNDQLWFLINSMFSKPILNEPGNANYVPTQILSELFKDEGLDGLCFKSHLAKGTNLEKGINLVIFEPSYLDMESCKLKYTSKVEYYFDKFDQREHT